MLREGKGSLRTDVRVDLARRFGEVVKPKGVDALESALWRPRIGGGRDASSESI